MQNLDEILFRKHCIHMLLPTFGPTENQEKKKEKNRKRKSKIQEDIHKEIL
jgi:hypothetical protein